LYLVLAHTGVAPQLHFILGNHGFLNPILAAAAMTASSVTVLSNSLRLRRFRPARLEQLSKDGVSKALNPVCKMEADENKAAAISEHKGKKCYSCARGCKKALTRTLGAM
jgi:YHS domain-containing protein